MSLPSSTTNHPASSSHSHPPHRAVFDSRIGAIFAAVGSAVGLGNIWRFPYEVGQNGGAAFLLVYFLLVLAIGLPVMLAEFFIGRRTHQDPVTAMETLARPGSLWTKLGFLGVFCALIINGFYFVVAGWTLEYFFQAATGAFAAEKSPEELTAIFTQFVASPVRPLVWMFVFIAMSHGIIVFGVRHGIETASKIMMPLLFLLLLILAVRSLTLPGGMEGLKFLFSPDFSKLSGSGILSAMSQALFSLSLGMGCMVTYSSYFGKHASLQASACWITFLDTFVAVLAGIVIFPAVFSFGIPPESGPTLVFITLPNVFQQMPLGTLWGAAFFLLLVIATLTSAMSLHEVFTVFLIDRFNFSRRYATLVTSVACAGLGVFSSLSCGILGHWLIGGMTFFDLLDFLSSKLIMPLGAMGFSVFVGWKMSTLVVKEEMTSGGTVPFYGFSVFLFLLRYVVPVAIAIIFINGLRDIWGPYVKSFIQGIFGV